MLDEAENLSANLMASAARGPMRRASLEDLIAAGDREACHPARESLASWESSDARATSSVGTGSGGSSRPRPEFSPARPSL